MNFDSGILVYLIFLAIILYSNHLKKRRQAQARAAQVRKIEVPEPAPQAPPVKKSLHDQRREKQLQTQRAASLEETHPRAAVEQQAVHGVRRRVPIDAARFKTRHDIRRAVVARVVLAPPKALD
jgi:hypothetical protein